MKHTNPALNFHLAQIRAILSNPLYVKGIASAMIISIGSVYNQAHAAEGDKNLDVDEWLNALKNGNNTATITGNTSDTGTSGKYSNITINADKSNTQLKLETNQKVLIQDTTHKYTSNYIKASGTDKKLTVYGGVVEIGQAGAAPTQADAGLLVSAESGASVNLNLSRLNVNNAELHISTSGLSSNSVGASNIFIGNSADGSGAGKAPTAKVIVGNPNDGDGSGNTTFGKTWSNIDVASNGEIALHASGKADIAAFGSNLQAKNVTINGGRLSFNKGTAGGRVSYNSPNTDINNGFVRVEDGSNATIRVGNFNLNGKSNVEIGGALDTYKANIRVSEDTTLAASNGITDGKAKLSLQADSNIDLSKAKLKEFLTGFKEDGSNVKYVDITDNTTKNAGKGNIYIRESNIALNDTDTIDVSDKQVFNFSKQKDQAGAIYADLGSSISAKNVTVTKKIDNAAELTIRSENLSLGSNSFNSSTTGTGVRRFFAKNVQFNAEQGSNTYTLQDELNLSNDKNGTIKGNVTVSGGTIDIRGGSHYELEQGKDLVLAKDRTLKPKGTQSALYIQNGSLKVSGKFETTATGSAQIADGSLDAAQATSLKIAGQSIMLGNNSAVILDGTKVLDIQSDPNKVKVKEDAFAKDALVNVDKSTIATVTLKGLGSMSMDQYQDLKQQVRFDGFFNGFDITDVKTDPQMDIGKVETNTPDAIYGNTQVKTDGTIDKQVSVGNVQLNAGNKLVIDSKTDGGNLVKLTNAGANSNSGNNFIQNSAGSVADVELAKAKSALQLQGTGNIGNINGGTPAPDASPNGKLYIGSPDDTAKADVTVMGSIGNTQAVGEITIQAKSTLNVTGDTVKTHNLRIQPGSSLTASNAAVTLSNKSTLYGDLKAKELTFNPQLKKDELPIENIIAGSATVEVEKLTTNENTILQIGEDKQDGLNGTLIAQKLSLNEGTLFVDPSFNKEASYAIVDELSGSVSAEDAGTLKGKAYVGKNAVLAVGFKNKEDVVSIIRSKLNEHGAFTEGSGVENALVLNKKITLGETDKLIIDPKLQSPSDGNLAAYQDSITFGNGGALVVTDKVFEAGAPGAPKQGTAITINTIKGGTPKVDASKGGVVILSGRFSEDDTNVQIFGGQNVTKVNLTKDLPVQSTNGLISGSISQNNGGRLDQLTLNKDRLREMFKNTSKPVADMLENVLSKGSNEMFDDPTAAGAQFISHVATDSKTGIEADRALYAASFAGAQQAAIDTSNAMTNVMMDRGEAINNSHLARRAQVAIANANYREDPRRKGNQYEITTPIRTPRDSTGVWVTPTYLNTKAKDYEAENVEYGAEIDIKGVTLGADTRIGNVAVGVAASYGQGDSEATGQGKGLKDDFDYYGLGLYTAMSFGQFSLIGDTSVTAMKHDITGPSGIQGFGNLSASVDSLAISAGVTGKYMFETPFMDITPHFGTRFLRLSTDSYDLYSNEAKSNLLNTNYDAQNIFSFPVGVNLSKHFNVNGWIVNPDIDLTVTANVGDTDAKSSNKIYGIKSPLDLTTQVMDDVTYRAKLGLGVTNGNFNSNLYFDYTGSKNTESYGISANVGYDF